MQRPPPQCCCEEMDVAAASMLWQRPNVTMTPQNVRTQIRNRTDVQRGKLSPPPVRVAMLCLTDDIISLASPIDGAGADTYVIRDRDHHTPL